MALIKDKIKDTVFLSIDSYNTFQPNDMWLEKDLDTVLFSRKGYTKDGKLDSMGLVNFLVLVEERIKTDINNNFLLDISDIIENKETLLLNLNTFIHYLESKITKK